MEKATFAGGCFWCMVKPFDTFEGIHKVTSGYMGGHVDNPSYEQVKTGTSGHLEVVEIEFDPALFPYSQLLEIFWQQIDPTDDEGQFQDRGDQYRTAIFYYTDEQREQAELEKTKLQDSQKFAKPIVTHILPATTFYPAEEYHQDFYKKDPEHYQQDLAQSGRVEFIEKNWK